MSKNFIMSASQKGSNSLSRIIKIKVPDLTQKLQTRPHGLYRFLYLLPPRYCFLIFAHELFQVYSILEYPLYEHMLCCQLRPIDQQLHYCFGYHVVYIFANNIEVRHDKVLEHVDFKDGPGFGLAGIVVFCSFDRLHSGHVDLFYVFLHVFAYFIITFELQFGAIVGLKGQELVLRCCLLLHALIACTFLYL